MKESSFVKDALKLVSGTTLARVFLTARFFAPHSDALLDDFKYLAVPRIACLPPPDSCWAILSVVRTQLAAQSAE